MNDHNPTREAAPSAELPVTQPQATSGQQRRQLLRAVSAGGALVGAGLPLAAHATGRPHCKKVGDSTNNYNPTASAVGSIIGSVTGTAPPVAGHHCTHYRDPARWSAGWTNGRGRSLTYALCADPATAPLSKMKYHVAFELTSPRNATEALPCEEVLRLHATSNEAILLGALLNANKCVPFAYTATQVVDLATGKNPLMGGMADTGITAKAVVLFRDYLSQKA